MTHAVQLEAPDAARVLLPVYLTAFTSIAFAVTVFGMPLHWETVPLAVPAATLVSALKLIGFAVVLFPLSLLARKSCIRYAQQKGTVSEY